MGDHLLVVQARAKGRPGMKPRLARVVHRQTVNIQAGIVANDPVKVFSIILCFKDCVFQGACAAFFGFAVDVQILERQKPDAKSIQQALKARELGRVRRADQNVHVLLPNSIVF